VNNLPLNGTANFYLPPRKSLLVSNSPQEDGRGNEATGAFSPRNGLRSAPEKLSSRRLGQQFPIPSTPQMATNFVIFPPIDAIERVQSADQRLSARGIRSGPAAGDFEMRRFKSALITLHGAAWGSFLRNDKFDASDFF